MASVPFVVRPASADESHRAGEPPQAYLERVASAKLDAVRSGDLGVCAGVLVADTIVVAPDGAILGKPADGPTGEESARGERGERGERDQARAMLERLAGASHTVETRFVLAPPTPGARPLHAQTVTTRVTFRALSESEVRAYVESGEGADKAGGYAAQGRAAAFIERIDGSYTNVVGLPLCEVVVALRTIGWLTV
jgi:septum formation protein